MGTGMKTIREISAEETYPLRREELRKNVTLSWKMQGDEEPETMHLGLFLDDELVSIASFMNSKLNDSETEQYQLRGMATAAAHQGQGYGQELLSSAESRLIQRGVGLLWCNARVVALEFYRKMGYEESGDPFELPQIGTHYKMFKKLG